MSFPQHGLQVYIPGYASEVDAAKKAAELGSNVLRTRIFWTELEQQQGIWDPGGTVVARYKNICQQARNHVGRQDIKLLPVFDHFPGWVDGVVTNHYPPELPGGPPRVRRHYSNSYAGCEQFGVACGHLMKDLGGYADLIEISNEPNVKVTNYDSASAGIPTDWYGLMSAYAMIWIDACTNSNASKGILMGSIDCLTGAGNLYSQQNPHPEWVLDAPDFYASKISDALNIWLSLLTGNINLSPRARLSCHPYPNMKQNVTGTQASEKVWERFKKIRDATGNRKLWITETGASSWHLNPFNQLIGTPNNGFARQVGFINHLMDECAARHYTQNLEGVVLWPMKDDDTLDGPPNDPKLWKDTGYYYKNGNIKPAGTTLSNRWNAWN